ncbi:MAG TPA: hypothetical protein DCX06_12295 [Opitutae bacterium]|nr:hypothetical protein [Opitutae bacterium]
MNRLAALFVFSVAVSSSYALEWRQGSVAVGYIEDGMSVTPVGVASDSLPISKIPFYFEGLVKVESLDTSRVTLLASNHVLVDYKGAGYFAIERFEQEADFEADWFNSELEGGQSRMIFNLRAGTLVIDQRKMEEASQLLVETPIGRLYANRRALWMIEISRDARKRTYGFTIHCVEGTVRLLDLSNRTFSIRSGQRISGAGAAFKPSVEVAEITLDALEYLEDFDQRSIAVGALNFSAKEFYEHTKSLNIGAVEVQQAVGASASGMSQQDLRPIVIEYAPLPKPVTPFKGEARPPSAYEAGLF